MALPLGVREDNSEADVHAALHEGVGLFNQGLFWECHEVLERVWLRDQNPRKRFLQGLIKVAAGYHHLQKGNWVGMENLLRSGRELLLPFGPSYMGIDLAPLLECVAKHTVWAQRARSGGSRGAAIAPPVLGFDSPADSQGGHG